MTWLIEVENPLSSVYETLSKPDVKVFTYSKNPGLSFSINSSSLKPNC